MPIQFTCPHCQKAMSVADQYGGQTGPCQACGQEITIPMGGMPAKPSFATPPPQKSGSAMPVIAIVVGVGFFAMVCVVGVLVALLLPAVQAARQAARRMSSSNNLKQIALAMHNYHDTYKSLPPAAVNDEDGEPRTSWRVAILPFMEQQALYEQYDLHQRWDDPENEFVSNTAIEQYHSPMSTEDPTTTSYFAVVGPEAVFEGDKTRGFRDIMDGTANTIMVVEVEGLNVPWAEPRDITYEELLDLVRQEKVGGNPGGFQVAFADGSVHFIQYSVGEETLKAMTTRNGQERVAVP